MQRLLTILMTAFIGGVILIGCNIGQTPENDVLVTINLPTESLSVSTADLIAATTSYELEVTKGDVQVLTQTIVKGSGAITMTLTEGSHTFRLDAKAGSSVIGSGSTTAVLVKGNNLITISLVPVGDVEAIITVEWDNPDDDTSFSGTNLVTLSEITTGLGTYSSVNNDVYVWTSFSTESAARQALRNIILQKPYVAEDDYTGVTYSGAAYVKNHI
jgi:hypothetical protein